MKRFFLALIVIAATPAVSLANEAKVLQFDDIRTQQAEIQAGVIARTGRYKDMDSKTRDELLRRQGVVLRTIEGKEIPTDLDAEQRTQVFNDLEWIEAAINRAQDEQLVCEYRKTIGSNRKSRVCRTAAQMREERERAREELERSDPQMRRGG
ncbi:hypothetical protein ACFPOA_11775 [Lysobacter niabensis]|uniref:hypothetical protein n=1 Tax=Agrilutibacter niabensis TaxID=380628 RepID=UPI00360DFF70